MPKGFTEDGKPILTQSEFMETILTERGYEKNVNGTWELVYPELNVAKEKVTGVSKATKPTPAKNVVKPAKVDTPKPAKATTGVTRDSVIANVNQFLADGEYNFSAEKATFLVRLGNENYELKITRKTAEFEFDSEFESVKDFGKQKIIKALSTLDFCEVGVIDTKGTVGFTDGKEYVTITITKKRK